MEAPTGTGKTLAVLFPSIKAVGEELAERIFYLTAKTITASVAVDTYDLLRKGGLRFKTVVLTAKEKICFLDEPQCDPEHCRYARGHFDRINDAMYDLLIHEDSFSRDKIMEYAQKYQVCPFEMSLDMSLFSDGVICDYNYVFDPHVYLRRFFQEGVQGNNIFLIDEASQHGIPGLVKVAFLGDVADGLAVILHPKGKGKLIEEGDGAGQNGQAEDGCKEIGDAV